MVICLCKYSMISLAVSPWLDISADVPQGTKLASLLFLVVINHYVNTTITFIDDTTLYPADNICCSDVLKTSYTDVLFTL